MRDPAHLCCLALASALGDGKLAYPDSPAYDASLASYYSAQQEGIRPACIVTPETTQDVSKAIKVLATHTDNDLCKFAIRSGGHTSWAGASNIAGGVTLDLRGLNNIDLSEDETMVQVGAGASWDAVYQKLDPLGRTVAGGRVAGVGVGGLTLGGGISHLSPQHGWTCDTVRNYQVVLADGTIAYANENHNADLFFALRGGGNSFGIVTRVDLETYEQGLLWSAFLVCDASVLDVNINEFVRLSAANEYDQKASFLISFAYAGSMGGSFIANQLVYTDAVQDPPIYENLMKLPTLQVTKGLKNMTTLSTETAAMVPKGARSLFRTLTLISTEAVLQAVYGVFNDAVRSIKDVPEFTWSISFDPIPPSFYARHAASNALGLTDRNGAALLVLLLDARWNDAAYDKTVESAAKLLFENIAKEAQALGAHDPYIYLNYAEPDQDPISSYGAENVRRLRAVRSRVDPGGLFTMQVPGGHKVPSE
ncbi:hypothetical protein F5883DRAFT_494823 [Diaporthe sp. PMI_573]|nr:hypothetical protein F5883DRAFT_494823 [Diaporthaceae sp. PMI_573]